MQDGRCAACYLGTAINSGPLTFWNDLIPKPRTYFLLISAVGLLLPESNLCTMHKVPKVLTYCATSYIVASTVPDRTADSRNAHMYLVVIEFLVLQSLSP